MTIENSELPPGHPKGAQIGPSKQCAHDGLESPDMPFYLCESECGPQCTPSMDKYAKTSFRIFLKNKHTGPSRWNLRWGGASALYVVVRLLESLADLAVVTLLRSLVKRSADVEGSGDMSVFSRECKIRPDMGAPSPPDPHIVGVSQEIIGFRIRGLGPVGHP